MEVREHVPLNVTAGWEGVFTGAARDRLETTDLPEFLVKQRWFAGKSRRIKSTRILDWAILETSHSALALVEVQSDGGLSDTYLLPLAMTLGDGCDELHRTAPNAVIAPIALGNMLGLLHDGVFDDQTSAALFSLIENEGKLQARQGRIEGIRGAAFLNILASADTPLPIRRASAEQSNTSILYGDRFILKLFRRQESGLNPDSEIGRYLTENTRFDRIPPFAGLIEYLPASEIEPATLAMLQGLVVNEGDGWKWTVEELDRFYETCAPITFPESAAGQLENVVELSEHPASQLARDHVGIYLDSAAILGRRTAELHLALASPTGDRAFVPEPLSSGDLQTLFADLGRHASGVFDILKERMSQLPDEVVEVAASVLGRRRWILDAFGVLSCGGLQTQRIRIHGDYHLGQVLRVKTDFVILDFEGEPARSLADRRSKQCPLKDVAGMLRSFSYAAYASLINYATRHPEGVARLEPWAQLWERSAAAEFLRAYRETARGADFLPPDSSDFRKLLNVFLLDKALYEVLYELNSRPAWVRIPLMGIISLQMPAS
jgi:maltose alpha-D-glucosyltransferase/alpha-amylase